MFRVIVVSVCTLAMCVGSSDNSLAFTKFGADWAYRRSFHRIEIEFEVCNKDTPPGFISAIEAAAAIWSDKKMRLSVRSEKCNLNGSFPSRNGFNQIDFGQIDFDAVATSKLWYEKFNINECDIRFNNHLNWNTSAHLPDLLQWDLISVAAHEFGHCLGLGHENRTSKGAVPIMNGTLAIGESRRVLTSDDITGRNTIYGR